MMLQWRTGITVTALPPSHISLTIMSHHVKTTFVHQLQFTKLNIKSHITRMTHNLENYKLQNTAYVNICQYHGTVFT